MRSAYLFLFLISAFGALFSGCLHEKDPSSVGAEGRAKFSWAAVSVNTWCTPKCDASAPVAERSVAQLIVKNPNELPPFYVKSENPDIAEFTLKTQEDASIRKVDVHGLRVGTAVLELHNERTGELIDRFAIKVRPVNTITTSYVQDEGRATTLLLNGAVLMSFNMMDAEGTVLRGAGGLDYAIGPTLAMPSPDSIEDGLSELFDDTFARLSDEARWIEGAALGQSPITVTAPSGARLQVPISTIDPQEVTHMSLGAPLSINIGKSDYVRASAKMDDEQVYGGHFTFALVTGENVVSILSKGRDSLRLQGLAKGDAIVRSTLGNVSAEQIVHVQ